ncbi:MAG: UDP-N-acetylmuramoyl-tripeptide--D-alanyl-D-alanine ligase [Flavobacteriales bacterium]|nr:UDP-N-acetylmuramoyl-tripeptide--D-alanyl-D-alanine ligase [Flavobacteriales bacterium]MCB9205295.1 UDP-N-acetylmuramoyl-tripeptide--D-alanyl-D-alanine ligase [Flavobacteriales bacterium]
MDIKALYDKYTTCSGISTDSRKITANCMYIALRGETFDGNKFALDSLEKGAKFAVVDDPTILDQDGIIKVSNGLKTLQDLSSYHRHQFEIPVIGITGSNGKTTTKELMHAVLSQKFNVLATSGNFNNHIGVPLTLFRLNPEHEIAIIEMGASAQGDIKELCDIADPNYALITNIGKAHLETMGGLEGVLKTKTELFDHIRIHGGKLLVHSCDKLLMQNASSDASFLYGALPTDDVQGQIVRDGNLVSVQWKRKEVEGALNDAPVVKTNLTGTYNLPNIMAAVATGIVFGLTDAEIAKGLSSYEPSNNRSEVRKKGTNTFILDAYNANPSSMEVAINNLVGSVGENHAVILGEMLEVGPTSAEEHRNICERLVSLKMKTVCLVGKEFNHFKNDFPFQFFENVEQLNEWLKDHPFDNETVLIKGSRGNKLEKAAELLLA